MRALVLVLPLMMLSGLLSAQMAGELNATMAGQNALDSGSVSGGVSTMGIDRAKNAAAAANANMANSGGTMPNPNNGFSPAPAVGPAIPQGTQPMTGGVGAPAAAGAAGGPAVAVGPGAPALIRVMVGRRVFCAVCNQMLDDAYEIQVPAAERDLFLDDGIHDDGIAGNGIPGRVEVIKKQYIGQECNTVKNRLINVVRKAESMELMEFAGLHVMSVDPTLTDPRMPNMLDQEQERDRKLRDWNNRFLADYRVDPNDPKSEYYLLYVPEPPMIPQSSVPPGYVAPQQRQKPAGPGGVGGGPMGAVPVGAGGPAPRGPGSEQAI